VTGGLLPSIDHAIARLKGGILACYTRSLNEDAPEESSLLLKLVVGTNGSVKTASAAGVSGLDASAVACMVRRAQTSTFPPPVGGPAEVTLPIVAHPPDTAASPGQ
jgi:hypothetical protein